MRIFEELEEERDRKSTKSAKETKTDSNPSQKVKVNIICFKISRN